MGLGMESLSTVLEANVVFREVGGCVVRCLNLILLKRLTPMSDSWGSNVHKLKNLLVCSQGLLGHSHPCVCAATDMSLCATNRDIAPCADFRP